MSVDVLGFVLMCIQKVNLIECILGVYGGLSGFWCLAAYVFEVLLALMYIFFVSGMSYWRRLAGRAYHSPSGTDQLLWFGWRYGSETTIHTHKISVIQFN